MAGGGGKCEIGYSRNLGWLSFLDSSLDSCLSVSSLPYESLLLPLSIPSLCWSFKLSLPLGAQNPRSQDSSASSLLLFWGMLLTSSLFPSEFLPAVPYPLSLFSSTSEYLLVSWSLWPSFREKVGWGGRERENRRSPCILVSSSLSGALGRPTFSDTSL